MSWLGDAFTPASILSGGMTWTNDQSMKDLGIGKGSTWWALNDAAKHGPLETSIDQGRPAQYSELEKDRNTRLDTDTSGMARPIADIAAIVGLLYGGAALSGMGSGGSAAGSEAGAGSGAYGLTAGEGSATGASGGLGLQNTAGSGLGFQAGGNTMGAGGGGLGFTMSPSVASTTGYGTGSMWGSGSGFNTDLASRLLKNMSNFTGSGSGSSSGSSGSGSVGAGYGGQNWMQKQAEEYRKSLLAHNLRSNKTPGYDFES